MHFFSVVALVKQAPCILRFRAKKRITRLCTILTVTAPPLSEPRLYPLPIAVKPWLVLPVSDPHSSLSSDIAYSTFSFELSCLNIVCQRKIAKKARVLISAIENIVKEKRQ